MGLALWISVLGVALSILQLVVVLSVFSGFQNFLTTRYTQISSEIIVIPHDNDDSVADISKKLKSDPSIVAQTVFSLGQGLVIHQGVGGAILEGIDYKSSKNVTPWKEIWKQEPLWQVQSRNPNWIWLGDQLAKKLNVEQGDSVKLLIAQDEKKKFIPFVVTAITKFGIYDHDLRYARVSLKTLERLFGQGSMPHFFKTKLKPFSETSVVARRLHEQLGEWAQIKPWYQVNQNIFLAVAHQKQMFFLILQIVIALGAVNVINMLLMNAQARRKDMAILQAMGLRMKSVFFFFLFQGSFIGSMGVFLGISAGVFISKLLDVFQPEILSESVYNISKLPIEIRPEDLAMVGLVSLGLCTLFSVVPALRAARVKPVRALRYE